MDNLLDSLCSEYVILARCDSQGLLIHETARPCCFGVRQVKRAKWASRYIHEGAAWPGRDKHGWAELLWVSWEGARGDTCSRDGSGRARTGTARPRCFGVRHSGRAEGSKVCSRGGGLAATRPGGDDVTSMARPSCFGWAGREQRG